MLSAFASFPKLQQLRQHPPLDGYRGFKSAWPDEKTIAAQDEKGTIILWNTKTGRTGGIRLPLLKRVKHNLYNLAFLPDNRTVLVREVLPGGYTENSRNIQFWDIRSKRCRLSKNVSLGELHNASPNGICAFADGKRNVEIWDYKAGKRKRIIKGNFYEAELSPDGRMLATINGHSSGAIV
ncbi:MAG TPA: hypothetical protein VGB77_03255 [Abditibacteriaceae bacterium]|jgi:WD40 repeat protein